MIAIIVWLLPEPDSPTMATRLARDRRGSTPAHRLDTSPSSCEKRTSRLRIEKDSRGHHQRSFGSSASRRPSPKKFSANSMHDQRSAGIDQQ
jgi:hypothetical protein